MFQEGQQIGLYTLVRRLGRGGFGEVWLADNPNDILFSQVALKLPNSDCVDIEVIRNEAKLWREVSGHENIVSFIEARIYEGQVVIVSEFVKDGSLSDLLKENYGKPLSPELPLHILLGILDGLEHLHKKQIVHRDLKPANILLENCKPRLADFGISRILSLTHQSSSMSVGTPSYMPPEAFEGKRSLQSDIWAVGVIFQQLLTGTLPFESTDPMSLMFKILQENPKPLPPDVPEAFRKIISKSLEKDRKDRFQNVFEIKQLLEGTMIGSSEKSTITSDPKRGNRDTELKIPITIFDVVNGATKQITVNDLEGDSIKIKIPKGIDSGSRLRITPYSRERIEGRRPLHHRR